MNTNSFTFPKFFVHFSLVFIMVLAFGHAWGQTPLTSTFESGNDGWTLSNFTRTNNSYSGSSGNYLRLSDFDNYTNNYTATATSGTINTSLIYNLELTVKVRYKTESGFDGFNIEYSPNNGTNWYALGSAGEGTNWYNSTDVDAIADLAHGWTGNNNAWQTARIKLPSVLENNANVKFRVNFKSDATNRDDGVCFDDFTVLSNPTTPTGRTYYAFGTNINWNVAANWTINPVIGSPTFDNPDNKYPTAGDYVIIHPGVIVNIPAGVNNMAADKITVNGTLDVTSTTGHNFSQITGNGTIRMAGNGGNENFPAGNCSGFIDEVNGGTLEVYGNANINLNNPRSVRHLKISMSGASAILMADYALNGNLTVFSGDFKINDNSSTVPKNLSVNGNVLVESAATMTVGTANAVDTKADDAIGNYHKYYHVFTVNGNFTNQGSVRFTNQTSPNYTTQTNTGAVSLYFMGATNNTFNCQGVTNLYYLVVNKGVDQTNTLTINAMAKNYFALFGDNDEDTQDDYFTEPNPENRKALWIKTGTLILEGFVTIPTLTEGSRDYFIGENAALVLNGPNVFVSSTAVSSNVGVHTAINYTGLSYNTSSGISNDEDVQAFYVNGTLKLNDGTLQSSNSYGVVYRAESPANRFEINGGTATISQFHISQDASAANAKMTFMQTGGVLNIVDDKRAASPLFDLRAGLGSFIMSGGTIYLRDVAGTSVVSAIYIACASSNVNVSGGTIIINNTAANNRVAHISSTAPLHNLILRANRGNGVQLLSALDINNDLTLEAETFNANSYNLTIGSDLEIVSGATYTSGNNTTIFDGEKRTNIYLPTGVTQQFYNVTIDKNVDDKDVIIAQGNATTAIQINNNLRIVKGGVDYKNFNIALKRDLYLADSLGTSESGTGKLIMNNNVQQNIVSVSGVIKNLQIDNSYSQDNISLTGNLNIYGTLTLTNGVFDINTYRLTMFGVNSNLTGGTFGTTRMIQTDGYASDGGLGLCIKANGTYVFPVGTDRNNTLRYTPLTATYSSFVDDGYVYLSVADNVLPTTNGNGGTMLSYYWHTEYSDFTTPPNISNYTFAGAESDDGTNPNNKFPGSWRAGKVLSFSPFTRSYINDAASVSDHNIIFNYALSPIALESADYSTGPPNRFNGSPEIYFTRYTSGGYDWHTAANWDKTTIGSTTHEVPVKGSIVIIREGVRMNVNAAFDSIGAVNFVQTLPTPNTEELGRLQFWVAGNYHLGVISGTGMISFNAANNPSVTGDFGDFGSKDYSYYLYFGGNRTLTAIPTPIPNLMLESYTYTINQNITTNGSLIVQGDGTVIPQQNMAISKNLWVGYWYGGTFQFPSQASPITVTIGGNVDFTNLYVANGDRNLTVAHNTQDVEHRLIVKGNILHGADNGSDFDLWNTNARERVILELQGEGIHSYSRTNTVVPQLYRIIMNKGESQTNSFTFNQNFTLNGTTNGATGKALELQNGLLVLNAPSLDINLTTGNKFSIPSKAGLTITQGTVRANGTDGAISLDGLLRINGGTLDMTGSATTQNYIEYGASDNANIDISSGSLIVGTQIRRLTTSTGGILNYKQTGGDVLIGVNSGDAAYTADRGMLEVTNPLSSFIFTGGTLTIQRQNGGTPTEASLLLNPTTYQIGNGTLTIGNNSTPTAQNAFGINSAIKLNNLTLNAGAGVDKLDAVLWQPLALSGDLTINTGATLKGNGKDLTLENNYINNGVYDAQENTTTMISNDARSFSGSGTETIYRFTKSGSGSLSLLKQITVDNTLTQNEGTIITGTNALITKGNVILNGTITSTSGNGLVFNGTSQQFLERGGVGMSYLDIVTVKNTYGVKVTSNGFDYNISKALQLEYGVFDIGGSLLELGVDAVLTDINPFSLTNMIQTNSSFQDKGVRKYLNAGVTTNFFFPVGQLNYNPLTLDLTSDPAFTTGTTAGYISVKPSNEFHPTTNDGSNYYVSGDKNNVLQCYWTVGAGSLTGYHGNLILGYADANVKVLEPLLGESDYIAARILLYNNLSAKINKYSTSEVNITSNTLMFHIDGTNENGIAGDYFAGLDLAIPDNVATYTTTSSGGNVNASSSFTTPLPSEGTPPSGAIINVASGANLVLNVTGVQLYKTHIEANGTLTIDGTSGHRLGIVTGTGTLKIVSDINSIAFPAGDYADFFSCSGGGVEFAGTGSYTVMAGKPQIRNMAISGSGTKTQAADLEVCNNFTLGGSNYTIPDNVDLKVSQGLSITAGTFNSGTNNYVTVLGNVTVNGATAIYEGQSSGSDVIGGLIINNGSFNTGSGGTISIKGNINYSGGSFSGGSGSSNIVMNGTTAQSITGNFTSGSQFHNLTIQNSSGINLAGNVTINNALYLTSGKITTNAFDLLLNANATITPSTGSTTSFINGKLYKIINNGGNFIFPVGTGSRWRPASVNGVSNGPYTWSAQYFGTSPLTEGSVSNLTPSSLTIKSISEKEYWKISDGAAPGGTTAIIGVSWDATSKVSSTQSEREKLEVVTWNNSTSNWNNFGGTNFSSGHSQSSGSFNSSSALTFSEKIITLGSSDPANPLPVELLYFKANPTLTQVDLYWSTASELNNHYFEIQRSTNGKDFTPIGRVTGNSTTHLQNNYTFTDHSPLNGISYYRLKQVDFNAESETFAMVAVTFNGNSNAGSGNIKLYPNPFQSGELYLELSAFTPATPVELNIFDITGKLIYRAGLTVPEDQIVNLIPQAIDFINKGIYVIQVYNGKTRYTQKLVIE